MKIYNYEKFPCGYIYEFKIITSIFDLFLASGDYNSHNTCPMHGKTCPKKEK